MKKENNFIPNLIKVIFSNVIVLLSGILVSLVLPKVMGVMQYGYYRIFMLYAVYASLLHFGFVDGVLLYYGGKDDQQIDFADIRTLSIFFIFFELIIGLVIITYSFFIQNPIYHNVCFYLGIYTIAINIVTYFQYLTQARMKFSLLAKMNSVQPVLNIGIILALLLFVYLGQVKALSYNLYLPFYLLTFLFVLVIYMYIYLPILKGKRTSLKKSYKKIIMLFKVGLAITISYQIGALIFNLDNQYILFFFNKRTFSNYSFAYSLIQILTTIINAISTVLFPYLNRQNEKKVVASYVRNTSYMLIVIFAALIAYYPIHIFVHLYLPKYVSALRYFRILLPGVAISNCIYSIIFNYYKVFRKIKEYLLFGITILLLAAILNYLAYIIFRDPYAIAFSSLIVLFIWYILTNHYIEIHYQVNSILNVIYMFLMIVVFEIITVIKQPLSSGTIYIVLYIVITIVFQRDTIMKVFKRREY